MSQEGLKSSVRLPLGPRSMASSRNESAEDWSHHEVVIHRLACGRRTLNQLRTIIETSLNEYFDKKSNKDWKRIVVKAAEILPHGLYELKPEIYMKLRPLIYPYEDEEVRKYVLGKMEKYENSLAPQQGLPRHPTFKRCIVLDSEDEGEAGPAEKRAKVKTMTTMIQEPTRNTLTGPPHSETPRTPVSVNAARTPHKVQQSNSDQASNVVNLEEAKPERSSDSHMQASETSIFDQEIEALEKDCHALRKMVENVETLKTAAFELQQSDKGAFKNLWERKLCNLNSSNG
jgi:hypothetical protein